MTDLTDKQLRRCIEGSAKNITRQMATELLALRARAAELDNNVRLALGEMDKARARVAQLEAVRDRAENLLIALGMGWDMDGVIDALMAALAQPAESAATQFQQSILDADEKPPEATFSNPEEMMSYLDAAPVTGSAQASGERRVRHKKRGSTYRVIGEGDAQTHDEIMDGDPLVIYQCEQDSRFWVRPKDEFEDGRFEDIAQREQSAAKRDEEAARELMGCKGEIFGEECGDIGEPCTCYLIAQMRAQARAEGHAAGIEEERERCAKVADNRGGQFYHEGRSLEAAGAFSVAAAIRTGANPK